MVAETETDLKEQAGEYDKSNNLVSGIVMFGLGKC